MVWFKVDDGFHGHPKVVELSTSAVGVWTLCGSWSAKYLTDGSVNLKTIVRLGGSESDAVELVQSGLWSLTDSGYQFKDWDKYQPLKATVEAEREAAQERMRAIRAKRKGTSSNERSGFSSDDVPANIDTSSGEVLSPRPSPSPSLPLPPKEKVAAKRGSRLPADWDLTPALAEWTAREAPAVNARAELQKFRDYWQSVPGAKGVKLDWDATWRNWCRRVVDSVPLVQRSAPSPRAQWCPRHEGWPHPDSVYGCDRCKEERAAA